MIKKEIHNLQFYIIFIYYFILIRLLGVIFYIINIEVDFILILFFLKILY